MYYFRTLRGDSQISRGEKREGKGGGGTKTFNTVNQCQKSIRVMGACRSVISNEISVNMFI